jgi:hypothetical protein
MFCFTTQELHFQNNVRVMGLKVSRLGQSMWDLWWTKWHRDRVSPVNIIPPSLSKLMSCGG